MALDEFLAGAQMFTQGLQRLGVSQALNEANQKIGEIQSGIQDQNERNQALAGASRDLTMRLSALGQSPQEIMAITSQLGPSQAELEQRALRQQEIEGQRKFEEQQANKAFGRQFTLQERRLEHEKELAGMRTIQGMSEAQLKRQEESKELIVPNLRFVGQGKPTKKDVEELKSSQAAASTTFQNVRLLGDLIKESGSEVWGAENYAKMNTVRTALTGNIKQLEKLGALDAGVWDYIENLLPDPTSIKANLAGFSGILAPFNQRNMENKIQEAENYVRNNLLQNLKARGFQVEPESSLYKEMFSSTLTKEEGGKFKRFTKDPSVENRMKQMMNERDKNHAYDQWLKERGL